jgi:hypothetical protein
LQAGCGFIWSFLASFIFQNKFEKFLRQTLNQDFLALPYLTFTPNWYLSPMPDFSNRLDIICLESEAFYALVEEVVNRMKEKNGIEHDKWIDDEEAMKLLHVSSKTTMQKYRDEGQIRFTQPSRKIILYDRDSIMEFLNKKVKDTF